MIDLSQVWVKSIAPLGLGPDATNADVVNTASGIFSSVEASTPGQPVPKTNNLSVKLSAMSNNTKLLVMVGAALVIVLLLTKKRK